MDIYSIIRAAQDKIVQLSSAIAVDTYGLQPVYETGTLSSAFYSARMLIPPPHIREYFMTVGLHAVQPQVRAGDVVCVLCNVYGAELWR